MILKSCQVDVCSKGNMHVHLKSSFMLDLGCPIVYLPLALYILSIKQTKMIVTSDFRKEGLSELQ